jgi:hypothetical protein
MSSGTNKVLLRRFFDDVCNGRNPAAAHQVFAPEFVSQMTKGQIV